MLAVSFHLLAISCIGCCNVDLGLFWRAWLMLIWAFPCWLPLVLDAMADVEIVWAFSVDLSRDLLATLYMRCCDADLVRSQHMSVCFVAAFQF